MVTADLDALLQRRELQLERFDPANYAARIKPGEDELVAYHKASAQKFMAPERATIEYVVLDLAAIGGDVTLSEDDLRKYYDENIARYTTAEERRASHILIKADKDQPAAERAKAKARAEAILAELRKAPASFAEVARRQSEDTGSAGQGGDLGLFGRGTMVKPFEDAVFAMKKGEISEVIESDFGYHIIELTDITGGQKKSFAEVQPVDDRDLELVEDRILRAPRADAVQRSGGDGGIGVSAVRGLPDDVTIGILQRRRDRGRVGCVAHGERRVQRGAAGLRIPIGFDLHVLDMHMRLRGQLDRAEQSVQTPEVLVLEP